MPNPVKTKQKYSSDRFYRSTNSSLNDKKVKSGKKVTSKKTLTKCPKDAKCSSAGALSSYVKSSPVKPKKTTKSDLCFKHNNVPKVTVIDYCRKCGDHIDTTATSKEKLTVRSSTDSNVSQLTSNSSSKSDSNRGHSRSVERIVISSKSISSDGIPSTSKNKDTNKEHKTKPILIKTDVNDNLFVNGHPVQQYYKNENFRRSSISAQEIHKYLKRISFLDPIKELPETMIDEDSDLDSIFRIYSEDSDSDSYCEICSDGDDYDSLKKLRDFRDDNYFETHSVQSRVGSKGSVTNLGEHKCNYRFYLNDRLFPVPFNTDHKNTIRCTECHLPLDENRTASKDINGTIQAKVRLGSGDDAQDMVLMLPAKEPLIIKQKRKEKEEEDVVYFGIIKLDSYGNSIFNRTLPSDSLALKYQKGYKEFKTPKQGYEYKKSEDFEVIVI